MAASVRPVMRRLSPRLQFLRLPPSPWPHQIRRMSGRYSDPSKRLDTPSSAPRLVLAFLQANSKGKGGKPSPESAINSLEARTGLLEWKETREYYIRRMRFAGMGLILTFIATLLVVWNLDLDKMDEQGIKNGRRKQQLDAPEDANARFQGKPVQVIGLGDGKRIVAQGHGEDIELVETGISTIPHFPRTIRLPSSSKSSAVGVISIAPPDIITNQEEYTLVGLGIRTVMWIQVYVVGMYVRTKDISALQSQLIHKINPSASTLVPSEKHDLKKLLLDPDTSRELWTEILKVPGIKSAWRISPTRNTDFGHLRDGFINGIKARTQEARKLVPGGESEYDAEDFGQSVQSLKGMFSGGKAPKGSTLILLRDTMGSLDILFQAKPGQAGGDKKLETLGTIPDERVAKLIWLGYLGGAKVSSPAAREGVAEGLVGFAGRPVGSVEAMVT